jgi:hypothetical protein
MQELSELRWMAVKVTPHDHGGETVWEETDCDSAKDTGRFLKSGARRAFLLQAGGAEGWLRSCLAEEAGYCGIDALLVESNRPFLRSVFRRQERAVFLLVLSGTEGEWKASLADAMDEADAFVLVGEKLQVNRLSWGIRKLCFRLPEGRWISPELVSFLRNRRLD